MESVDADMLCGLALLSTRRFLQANETFQRAEQHLFVSTQDTKELQAIRALRAMTFSILAADGLSHVNQLYDKLLAYRRTTQYYLLAQRIRFDAHNTSGAPPPEGAPEGDCADIHPATDVSTGLASLQPLLTEALLSNLQHPVYAVRTAAARSLQYVLDHVNCSVGGMFPKIFQSLVQVYPVETTDPAAMGGSTAATPTTGTVGTAGGQEGVGKKNQHIDEKHVVLLLETCYNMFPSLSRPELQSIVTGSVEPYLIETDKQRQNDIDMPSLRLLLQLFRVLLLVTLRLRGDMPLKPESVIALLRLGLHRAPVIRRSARLCWDAVARQVPRWPSLRQGTLGKVFDWCRQQILLEEQGGGSSNTTNTQSWLGAEAETTPSESVLFLVRVTTDLASHLKNSHQAKTMFADSLLNFIPVTVSLIRQHCFAPDNTAAAAAAHTAQVVGGGDEISEQQRQDDMLSFFGSMWECVQALKSAIPQELAPPSNALAYPLLRLAHAQCCVSSPSAATLGVLRCLLQGGIVQPQTTLPNVDDELNPTPQALMVALMPAKKDANKDVPRANDVAAPGATPAATPGTMGDFLVQLLSVLVQWVPHSVNDDTFHCLSMLLRLTQGMLSSNQVRWTLKNSPSRSFLIFCNFV